MFVALGRQVGVDGEAESSQLAIVVHDAVREEFSALHVLGHVEPVMSTLVNIRIELLQTRH